MNTTSRTPITRRIRTSLSHAWQDQVAANRALLRLTPYFDQYRQDGR